METVIDNVAENAVVFDYTKFLSKSCQQRLSLIDALKYLVPSLEITVKTTRNRLSCIERLEEKALKVLSSNASDTQNLTRLLYLAKQEGIKQLIVYLPYSLEQHQLDEINNKINSTIEFVQDNTEQLLFILD
ncbi:hypothetical protein [Photobacterium aquimaris]|uniref:Uncharacterized protein n=1 Tax=Photobacterium aquimaris TaxID=512643 RepID=A0A2T3HTI6_9GAMM|nr:hypothetical protein [Photobacterium aquimaris]OBU21066.1 hypothetical protein AYY21_17140 [Photobacterium aquimaris]PQJ41007.1 hypothetical protein BTN98_04965 [Photobacterium aquimaris]PST98337.1 hypothetical protein C0W81_18060 [Photobacterium aquimaris]